MSWLAAATGENQTLSLYEIKHALFFLNLQVLIHCQQFGKAFLYFYENKGLYRQQTLLGLNILSLNKDH